MDVKEIDILGDQIGTHWYYKSKAAAVYKALQGLKIHNILDVGAGSGFFSKYLISNTGAKESWCVDTAYDSEFDEKYLNGIIHYRKVNPAIEPDLVLLVDVLEHIEDDTSFLQDYVRNVPKGTTFFISVPAFNFLWSQHDVFLEHKRRYSLKQLEDLVTSCHLSIDTGFYYFGAVLPIAVVTRLMKNIFCSQHKPQSQLQSHSKFVNSFLSSLCSFEINFMLKNRFAGLSAMCVAKKNS